MQIRALLLFGTFGDIDAAKWLLILKTFAESDAVMEYTHISYNIYKPRKVCETNVLHSYANTNVGDVT